MPYWVLGQVFHTPLQRPVCCALIALLLHSGCATYQPPATVSEADRNACEEFAKAEAASVEGYPITANDVVGVTLGSFGVALPTYIVDRLVRDTNARQQVYSGALGQCLEPEITSVATLQSLHKLADRYADQSKYAEAELLYKRALAIQEKDLAAGQPSDAAIVEATALLEDYAALLRKSNRDAEADEMEARAKAIRDAIVSGTTTNP